jgi:phosphoglycolate phosphatase-like HAD superfamily hydrolase
MPSLKKCFIFDFDDTLADNTHRMPLLRSGNWDLYYAACRHDPVIRHVAEVANALHAFGYAIVIISGRSESTRADTDEWLERGLECFIEKLYLRPEGDFRPNSIVKLEALARLRAEGYEPLMAFDDQPQTCEMWRSAGVPCAQVKSEKDFVEYTQQERTQEPAK